MPKEALYKYVGDNINQEHMRMLPTDMNIGKDLSETGNGLSGAVNTIGLRILGLDEEESD